MSINFIYPDLWTPTASLLQNLTVMQQCLCQMIFRNDYEFIKQLAKPGLVRSRLLSILLLMNGESIFMPACVRIISRYFEQFSL